VLYTVDCWWDVTAGRLTMARGIFDGYYPVHVDSDVVPLELHPDENGLRVVLANPQDAQSLASALDATSALCQESYGRMHI
jgi:hypothetical protein